MTGVEALNIGLEIKHCQNIGKVEKHVRVIMNFLNEPLMDKHIIEKIMLIKESCNCNIDFYTNGVFAHKYKDVLIKNKQYIGGIIYSNYGDTIEDWEHVAGIKITEENFKNMKKAIDEISNHINVRHWNAWSDGNLYDFSTRAGTAKKVIPKDAVKTCEWVRPYNYVNIHSNGDTVLCCQDWKRETKYGNIFQDTLSNILESAHYKDIQDKALGKESDANFICKRCKWGK